MYRSASSQTERVFGQTIGIDPVKCQRIDLDHLIRNGGFRNTGAMKMAFLSKIAP